MVDGRIPSLQKKTAFFPPHAREAVSDMTVHERHTRHTDTWQFLPARSCLVKRKGAPLPAIMTLKANTAENNNPEDRKDEERWHRISAMR